MNTWAIIWAAWLVLFGASFWILEWMAWRKHATLSETLRRWLGVDPPKPWRRVSVAVFASLLTAFTAWFIPHITG